MVKAIACIAECGGRCGNSTCAQTMTHLTTCELQHCDRCIRLKRLTSLHAVYCHLRHCKVPGCRVLREADVEEMAADRKRRKRKPKGVTIVRAKDEDLVTAIVTTPAAGAPASATR